MEPKSYKKELYQGTIWAVIDNAARQGISLVVFIILARILKPEMFGLLSVSIIIVNVFKSVTYDSIASAVVKKLNPSDLDYSTAFWFCVMISVPAFLVLFALAGYLEIWMGTPGAKDVIRGLSFMLIASGVVRMHEAWLTYHLKFRSLAIRSVIATTISGIISIILALKGYGVISLVAQYLVSYVLELILLWFITPWRPTFDISWKSFVEIYHFSKHMAVSAITSAANQNSDIFFVTYYLGTFSAGLYSTGKKLSNTLNFVISSPLLRVSVPAFSRLQNEMDKFQKAFIHSTALTAMLTAPVFIGIAYLSRDVTLVLLGQKWIDSVIIMQVVTAVGFLTTINIYSNTVMLVKDKPQWIAGLSVFNVVVNIISFIIFTRYGLLFTALAFSIRTVLIFPISTWLALKLAALSWKEYLTSLLPSLISTCCMLATIALTSVFLVHLKPVLRLSILIPEGIAVYGSILYFVMPAYYKAELYELKNRILRSVHKNEAVKSF